MKKAGQLLAVLTAASVLLSGCEKLKDVTTTSVYVSKNGVVTEAIVEDYSKDDDYTEDELKVFVEDDIKKFTEERGDADSVKLEKCQIKEDKVEIRMEYGDYQSYADYHGAEFFAGTLDEAEEAGYDFSASFVDSKGNEVSVEDAVKGVKHVRVIVCEEPLEIVTEDPTSLLPDIQNAGAVFLGAWSPEPLGDYLAGPDHVLPTSGTARFFSPLSVDSFLKTMSVVEFSRETLAPIREEIVTMAEAEHLTAHANSIRVRFE